jgi:phosphoglycerate dehydrogenase-like enzyme
VTPLSRHRGLLVTNARGVFSRPIAEYVVMMCLVIARRLPQLLDLQRERTWQPLRATELGGLVVGIVGYGSIARWPVCRAVRDACPRRAAIELAGGHANVESWASPSTCRAPDAVVIAVSLTDETGLVVHRSCRRCPVTPG